MLAMAYSSGRNTELFDSVANIYDKIRPLYPGELISDLVCNNRIWKSRRILEIGCGTGQLTSDLAAAGISVTAMDTGKNLIETASRKLGQYPNVQLIQDDFDIHDFHGMKFDAVIAATAFHWLDPETRFRKAAKILNDGGKIAIIDTQHVQGGDQNFFNESQKCYREWDPATRENYLLPSEEEINEDRWIEESAPFFSTIHTASYPCMIEYTASEYIQLLKTYSDILSMEPAGRKGLLQCIETLIRSEFGGRIRKKYLFSLFIAEKKLQ